MVYWDTSALVKLYVAEADSHYFLQLIAGSAESIICSAIATAEMLCVFHRKEYAGALKTGAAKRLYRKVLADIDAGRILTVPYGRDVQAEAENLVSRVFSQTQPLLLRSLDLIHLSTALSAGATKIVATDARLRNAAVLAGLKLLP